VIQHTVRTRNKSLPVARYWWAKLNFNHAAWMMKVVQQKSLFIGKKSLTGAKKECRWKKKRARGLLRKNPRPEPITQRNATSTHLPFIISISPFMLCYLDPCHFRHALVLGDLATSQQLKFSDDATQDPAKKSRKVSTSPIPYSRKNGRCSRFAIDSYKRYNNRSTILAGEKFITLQAKPAHSPHSPSQTPPHMQQSQMHLECCA
jgi:hypothetical protein